MNETRIAQLKRKYETLSKLADERRGACLSGAFLETMGDITHVLYELQELGCHDLSDGGVIPAPIKWHVKSHLPS